MMITPYSDLDYNALFGSLEPSNIIRLFNALIMEEKILVVSSDLSLLFPVLEASLELLSPLEWPHPYFPVAPVNMVDDFDEWLKFPGAFYFGAQKKAINWPNVAIPPEVVVVDLDRNRVLRSKGAYEGESDFRDRNISNSQIGTTAPGIVRDSIASVASVSSAAAHEPEWEDDYDQSSLDLGHPHLPSRYTFKIYQTLAKVGAPIFLSQNSVNTFEAPPMSPLATPAERIIASEVRSCA